ncbi:class I SAM-dependent methyltransferase, partial [Candidatus Woesearchaeota archaeon]|nr:class I SAM-dependent methyltransferase [Candidatus Woesearchaeota archaeon]
EPKQQGDERMPIAGVYEEQLKYMPYAKSIAEVVELVVERAPANGMLVDLMSGTGHLLGEIGKRRQDLGLVGVDIDQRYVDFAREHHPGITFEQGDVLTWQPKFPVDVFTCTGSLHHVPYDEQEDAVRNMATMIRPEGFGIISDCYVDDYADDMGRKLAANRLGYEYLQETIRNGAPDEVVAELADILKNDVTGVEFKTSFARRFPVFKKFFRQVETFKMWPDYSVGFGDYVTVLGVGNEH